MFGNCDFSFWALNSLIRLGIGVILLVLLYFSLHFFFLEMIYQEATGSVPTQDTGHGIEEAIEP